jgi:hypothetical protein
MENDFSRSRVLKKYSIMLLNARKRGDHVGGSATADHTGYFRPARMPGLLACTRESGYPTYAIYLLGTISFHLESECARALEAHGAPKYDWEVSSWG